jgi:hypothetical protein
MTKTMLPVERSGTAGRPAYSDAVRNRLLSGLRLGMTRAAAAGNAGISRQTFYDWINGDEGFAAEVEIAEGKAEARYTSTVSESTRAESEGIRLKAASFWLERRRPNEWRDRTSVEVTLPPEVQEARSRELDDLRSELHALGEELLRRGTDRTRKAHKGGG